MVSTIKFEIGWYDFIAIIFLKKEYSYLLMGVFIIYFVVP